MPGSGASDVSLPGPAADSRKRAAMALQKESRRFHVNVVTGEAGQNVFEMAAAACFPMRMQSGMPIPEYALPASWRPGMAAVARLDFGQASGVSDGILRHGAGPSKDAPEGRRGAKSGNVAQLVYHRADDGVVAFRKNAAIVHAPQKAA